MQIHEPVCVLSAGESSHVFLGEWYERIYSAVIAPASGVLQTDN